MVLQGYQKAKDGQSGIEADGERRGERVKKQKSEKAKKRSRGLVGHSGAGRWPMNSLVAAERPMCMRVI
jgi:hypothetical protein